MGPLLMILFLLVCVLLIGVILLQKGRGGGLSGAFGGAGGHSAFGSRTGDMFTWITVVLVALFLLLGVATVKFFRPAQLPTARQTTGEPAEEAGQAASTQPAEGKTSESTRPSTAPAASKPAN
jgi:preprotein translocase subunit SecG